MAFDKIVDSAVLDAKFSSIANALRNILGLSRNIADSEMPGLMDDIANEVNDTQTDLISQIKTALEGKASGGASTPAVKTTSVTPSSNATSIQFTGLSKQPIAFAVIAGTQITLGTTRYVTSVWFDGTTTRGTYGYRSGSTAYEYVSNSYFSSTYSNGTLTVKTSSATNGGNFKSGCTYYLLAVY